MDDSPDSGFWPKLTKLFGSRSDSPIEQQITDAYEDGELKADVAKMLNNVLNLGSKQVVEIIIPRPDITCVELDATLDELVTVIIDSGHTRIPVYKQNRDNIMGIVHAKDALSLYVQHEEPKPPITSIMREPFFIPETKNVMDLLQEFKSRKVHMAIALDEYGGTSGLVTLEDVLEVIVGEIEDEYDAPRPEEIQHLENMDILVSGRALLEDLEGHLELDLVSNQVETIGGYICEHAGRVPKEQEAFTIDGHEFFIKEADAKQVRWILIRPPQSAP